jgi:hypothetical protein
MFANEDAIAEAWCDQVNEFADEVILMAHNTNKTTHALVVNGLGAKASVTLANEPGYMQSKYMNKLMWQAFGSGADWVLPLDFDEFLPFRDRKALCEYLDENSNFDLIHLPWRNLALKDISNPKIAGNVKYAHTTSKYNKVIINRRILNKSSKFEISQGNHMVISDWEFTKKFEKSRNLFHLPIQSKIQFEQKVTVGSIRIMESNLGAFGGHWIDYYKSKAYQSEVVLSKISTCYPVLHCQKIHLNYRESFDFPYIDHPIRQIDEIWEQTRIDLRMQIDKLNGMVGRSNEY